MGHPTGAVVDITPQMLLRAYAAGVFPMSEGADDPGLFWVEPRIRGILPLDGLVVSRSLAKIVRMDAFEIRVDTEFDAVIAACAAPAEGRYTTWINRRIRTMYRELFDQGHCHTIEAWRDNTLVGGLYGVSLGGAFFGESMFHRVTDASKVALVHLVARLRRGGFRLLDTQFVTPHLASLGAIEMSRRLYRTELEQAVSTDATFTTKPMTGTQALDVARESSP